MTHPNIAEQREILYAHLQDELDCNIEKFHREDVIPPCASILNPRLQFPDSSKIGMVEWSVRLYETRRASGAVGADFDTVLSPLLLRLGKGCGMGYVLDRVDNVILNAEGYPLPGYVVIGTVSLANC